jgi:hypothetical protein
MSVFQFPLRLPLTMNFLVQPKPGVAPATLRAALRREMLAIDPELPPYRIKTKDKQDGMKDKQDKSTYMQDRVKDTEDRSTYIQDRVKDTEDRSTYTQDRVKDTEDRT